MVVNKKKQSEFLKSLDRKKKQEKQLEKQSKKLNNQQKKQNEQKKKQNGGGKKKGSGNNGAKSNNSQKGNADKLGIGFRNQKSDVEKFGMGFGKTAKSTQSKLNREQKKPSYTKQSNADKSGVGFHKSKSGSSEPVNLNLFTDKVISDKSIARTKAQTDLTLKNGFASPKSEHLRKDADESINPSKTSKAKKKLAASVFDDEYKRIRTAHPDMAETEILDFLASRDDYGQAFVDEVKAQRQEYQKNLAEKKGTEAARRQAVSDVFGKEQRNYGKNIFEISPLDNRKAAGPYDLGEQEFAARRQADEAINRYRQKGDSGLTEAELFSRRAKEKGLTEIGLAFQNLAFQTGDNKEKAKETAQRVWSEFKAAGGGNVLQAIKYMDDNLLGVKASVLLDELKKIADAERRQYVQQNLEAAQKQTRQNILSGANIDPRQTYESEAFQKAADVNRAYNWMDATTATNNKLQNAGRAVGQGYLSAYAGAARLFGGERAANAVRRTDEMAIANKASAETKAGKMSVDILSQVGLQAANLPFMVLGGGVGQIAEGLGYMKAAKALQIGVTGLGYGTSSAGQELQHAYDAGATKKQARTSAAVSGALEVLFGGMSEARFVKAFNGDINAGGKYITNALKRVLSETLISGSMEGVTEYLTSVGQQTAARVIYNNPEGKSFLEILGEEAVNKDNLYAGALGAVMGGGMGAVGGVGGYQAAKQTRAIRDYAQENGMSEAEVRARLADGTLPALVYFQSQTAQFINDTVDTITETKENADSKADGKADIDGDIRNFDNAENAKENAGDSRAYNPIRYKMADKIKAVSGVDLNGSSMVLTASNIKTMMDNGVQVEDIKKIHAITMAPDSIVRGSENGKSVVFVKKTGDKVYFVEMAIADAETGFGSLQPVDIKGFDTAEAEAHIDGMDLPLAQKETIRQDMQGVGNLGDGFVQGQTEQNFGENSEKKGVVKTEELTAEQMKVYRQMSSFAEARGGRIVVRDDMEPGNPGCIIKNDDGTFEIVVSNEALADYVVMGHELTHALEGTEEYGEYAKFIESELESRGVSIAAVKADITRVYAEHGKILDDLGAEKELIAMYTAKHLFDDQVVINRLAVEKPNLFQRIWEWIQDKIASLRGRDSAFYVDTRKRFVAAYRSAGGAYEGRWGEDTGRQDWLSPKFEQEYNNWIKNGRKDRGLLFVGRTSKALRSIGVKNQRIVWDTGKINKTLAKHKNLNDEILKQVPNIIENPVLIMESISRENKGNNRVVMYGEVYDINNLPVLAVLELEPNNKQGVVINEIKIASTYSKDSNAQATQKLIDNSKILYIDPNKKRTENWLSLNRLQLPLGVSQFGSIGRVAYSSDVVKRNAKENSGNFNSALGEQLLAKGFASDNSIRKNGGSDTQNSIDFDIDEIISENQKGDGKAWSETVKEFDKVKKKVKTGGKQENPLYEGLFELFGKKKPQAEVLKGSLADVLGIETESGRKVAASLEEKIGKKRIISHEDRRTYFASLFGEYQRSHGDRNLLERTRLWQIFTTYLDDLQEANGLRRNMPRMKDVPRFEVGENKKSAAKTQQETKAQKNIHVGIDTIIKIPYMGELPKKTAVWSSQPVLFSQNDFMEAKNNIIKAQAIAESGLSVSKIIKEHYEDIISRLFKGKKTVISNLQFKNSPYEVFVGKSVVGKTIYEGALVPEKFVVFKNLKQIIETANYVGSSQYIPHGSKKKDTVRFDHFENVFEIDGDPYLVKFEVEVFPGTNNYKVHRVEKLEVEKRKTEGKSNLTTDTAKHKTAAVEKDNPLFKNSIPQNAQNGKSDTAEKIVEEGGKKVSKAEYDKWLKENSPKSDNVLKRALEGTKEKGHKLYADLVDSQNAEEQFAKIEKKIKGEGRAITSDRLNAVRNASGVVDYIFSGSLVTRDGKPLKFTNHNGEKVNCSFAELFRDEDGKTLSKKDMESINLYMQHRHNIDCIRNGRLFMDCDEKVSSDYIRLIETQNPWVRDMATDIKSWYGAFMQEWAVGSGLMSKFKYDFLQNYYPNYVPGFRVDKKGIRSIKQNNGRGEEYHIGSATKRAEGSTKEIMPIQESYMQVVESIVKKARKNEMVLGMFDSAAKHPQMFATFLNVTDYQMENNVSDFDSWYESLADYQKVNYEEIKSGNNKITCFKDGKIWQGEASAEVVESLNLLGESGMDHTALNAINKIYTKTFKTLTTGVNPVFAVANIIRDTTDYFIFTEAKGLPRAAASWLSAWFDIATKTDVYKEYLAHGNKNAGYYNQNKGYAGGIGRDIKRANKGISDTALQKAFKPVLHPMKFLVDIMEAAETVSRMAEYKNIIKNQGESVRKGGYRSEEVKKMASAAAADVTVNFSRFGKTTKLFDTFAPYLNASVQGIDKYCRMLKKHPVRTTLRSGLLLTLPTFVLWLINKDNDEYDKLSDRVKDAYFVIPNWFGEKNENGDCMEFIKIPKTRETSLVFCMVFERFCRYITGDEDAWRGMGYTIGTNLPVNPITENAFSTALQISTNTDYGGRSIVPGSMEDLSPENQWDINTSRLAIAVSKHMPEFLRNTKLGSPKNIDYLIDQTTGVLGDIVLNATSMQNSTWQEGAMNALVQPFIDKFTASSYKNSQVLSDFYDDYDKIKNLAADSDFANTDDITRPVNRAESYYYRISSEISQVYKWEKDMLSDPSVSKADKKEFSKLFRIYVNELAGQADYKAVTKAMADLQKYTDKQLDVLTGSDIFKGFDSGVATVAKGFAYNAAYGEYVTDGGKQLSSDSDTEKCQKLFSGWKESGYEYGTYFGTKAMIKASGSDVDVKNVLNMQSEGIKADTCIEYLTKTSGISSDKDANGKSIIGMKPGGKMWKVAQIIASMDCSNEEKNKLFENYSKTAGKQLGKTPWHTGKAVEFTVDSTEKPVVKKNMDWNEGLKQIGLEWQKSNKRFYEDLFDILGRR